MALTLSDHVVAYPDALSPEHCAQLIAFFEASPQKEIVHNDYGDSFMQVNLTRQSPKLHELVVPLIVRQLRRYREQVGAEYWPHPFFFEHVRVKRYMPNGRDRFPPHVDVRRQEAGRRFMSIIAYLNKPEGGETTFPQLDISITPETGKLLIFPPFWMFPHAGLPPRERPKYILHTYICYPSANANRPAPAGQAHPHADESAEAGDG